MEVGLLYLIGFQTPNDDMDSINSSAYNLYITAHHRSSVSAGGPYFSRQSPWAILDRFSGHADAPNAPDWMHWPESSAYFSHRTAFVAELFMRMATWEVNSEQVSGHFVQ
jgi:hypothetical protein